MRASIGLRIDALDARVSGFGRAREATHALGAARIPDNHELVIRAYRGLSTSLPNDDGTQQGRILAVGLRYKLLS